MRLMLGFALFVNEAIVLLLVWNYDNYFTIKRSLQLRMTSDICQCYYKIQTLRPSYYQFPTYQLQVRSLLSLPLCMQLW